MRTIYDDKTDSLFVRLTDGRIVESEEVRPGIILDFDADGRLLAVEIIRARANLAASSDFTAASARQDESVAA